MEESLSAKRERVLLWAKALDYPQAVSGGRGLDNERAWGVFVSTAAEADLTSLERQLGAIEDERERWRRVQEGRS
jgi:hypothetical protein